jgi:hypothetical protein
VEEAMEKVDGGDITYAYTKIGTNWLAPTAPERIMSLYNNGYKGVYFEESSEDAVFDVEVESLLNQTPAVSFPHIIESTI